MGTRLRCWRLAREHRLVASACLSAVVFMTATMFTNFRHLPGSQDPAIYAVAAVVYLSLAAAYRYATVAVAVSAAGSVALITMGNSYPITMPALFASLFLFAFRNDRPRTLAVAVPVKLALLLAHMIASPGIASLVVVLWAALATTLGNAARNHRAHVAEVEERARRAERDAEEQARRRVAEERLRIARDLHDAVGHHVALISVQAGALSCLLDEDQAEARQSLAHIQQASADALEDLRVTVGLLREPGDGGPASALPVDPVPGLARLDELIGSFADAGLTVTRTVTGRPTALPEAADVTAYRVIQESLTNIRKHAACATARLQLRYDAGALRLTVDDDGPPAGTRRAAASGNGTPRNRTPGGAASGTGPAGHGITGMRERVAALGGRLSAGPRPAGGYRVLAELPLPLPSPAGERAAQPRAAGAGERRPAAPAAPAAPAEVS